MAEERVWPTRWTPWSLLVSALGYAVAMDKDADSYEVWCAKRDALAREVAEMLEQHYTQASRAAPREPGEACPDCGYDVLVTDPDLRDPVEARVHAIDCPRTRYVVEYGVEAPPNVRHVRPHRSGCGHYDCSAPRPDAGDGTGET